MTKQFFYTHKNGIALRKVNYQDLSVLRDLKDESWFGTVNTVCLNPSDQVRWFEKISNDPSCLYLIAHETATNGKSPVGLYGFTDWNSVNQSCTFTHSVYKDYRGQGLGKKTLQAGIDLTFEVFNIRRIETWILDNNKAELKTSASVGFQIEGTKKQAVFKCGEYLDCHLLGLLRDEWVQSERVKKYGGVCNTSYVPKDNY